MCCKTLYWLRNAHSEKATGGVDDFHRSLSKKGKKQVRSLCRYLQKREDVSPEVVFCSGAARCRQTFDMIADNLPNCHVVYHHFLYLASGYTVLELLSFLEDAVGSVLVVGHNRALSELANLLLLDGKKQKALKKCRYATFVQVNFDDGIRWHEINFKKGFIQDVFYP